MTAGGPVGMSCRECLWPCELHNVRRCATCHNHDGECEYGGCFETAAVALRFRHEVRRFCRTHAEDPHFSFARAGVVETTLLTAE